MESLQKNIPNKKAGTIVIDNKNNILMVEQSNNKWSLPKGSIKVGEDTLTAAIRETLEETGIDLTPYTYDDKQIFSQYDSTYVFFVYRLPLEHTEVSYTSTSIDSRRIRWIYIPDVYTILGKRKINLITCDAFEMYISKIPGRKEQKGGVRKTRHQRRYRRRTIHRRVQSRHK